jgi:hypothetical protein
LGSSFPNNCAWKMMEDTQSFFAGLLTARLDVRILIARSVSDRAFTLRCAMPAYARKDIVDETVVGVYHCVSRCVRRAFLCGTDDFSGRNFDHRKVWMQHRLEFLAAIFGLDVLGFSLMSNHLHVLLRNRPDVVAQWSDEEVARRWYRLHPLRRNADGTPAEPLESELAFVATGPERLATLRTRLASISWFMASLCEPMARRANREDGCTGRFFEGRYKSQRIADDAALLACSMYIDLNPVRAALAENPETSEFTAAFERIAARQQLAGLEDATMSDEGPTAMASTARDGWLSPVPDADVPGEPSVAAVSKHCGSRRASDRGFLSMTLDEYLELLDWTGRQVRADKRGAIPLHLAPILERLHINGDAWVDTIDQFGRLFRRAAGRVASMAALAAARGKRWFHGVSACRTAFG